MRYITFPTLLLIAAYGMAQTACDSVNISSVNHAAFSDSTIEVLVGNTSSTLFDYPGFILYDQNSDTLAKEIVNYFGVGSQQVHQLQIHPSAMPPVGAFSGTLELWTGFYDSLACSWAMNIDLCPPPPCVDIHPYVANYGGAIAIGTFNWVLLDSVQTSVATGHFELTGQQQDDFDTTCVTPGAYTLEVSIVVPPMGGQLVIGATSGLIWSGVQANFISAPTQAIDLEFYPNCIPIIDGVDDAHIHTDILIKWQNGRLSIDHRAGHAIGSIEVFDSLGRSVLAHEENDHHWSTRMNGSAAGNYTLVLKDHDMRQTIFVGGN